MARTMYAAYGGPPDFDEFLVVGTAYEVARYLGIREHAIHEHMCRQTDGSAYKIIEFVDRDDDDKGQEPPEQRYRSLRDELRDARISAGMTQSQLAALAGVSKSTICNIECGGTKKMRPERIEELLEIIEEHKR